MRASEFIFLKETGLNHAQIAKDFGNYLDQLINFIANETPVELEGKSIKRLGTNFVTFEKSEAIKLSQAYYGQDTILSDKSNMKVTGTRNHIVPPGDYKNLRLIIKGTDDTVPLGDVLKSGKFKGGKGFNTGDVGEAFLGAAVTAKLQSPGADITEKDVIDIINKMKVTEGAKNKTGEVWTEIVVGPRDIPGPEKDQLYFKLVLNRTSFSAIEKARKENDWHPAMVGLNKSAVQWANNNAAVKEAIRLITSNGKDNKVTVTSDGVVDQKGTKADLFLTVDGATINLLSAKAGNVKQFGQDSGNTYAVFLEYFKKIFGVIIPESYKLQLEDTDGTKSYKILQKIYAEVYNELSEELKGNTTKEVGFLERLYKGIAWHATRDDPKVSMVILKDTPTKPGYQELFFGPELHEAMKQIDLKITFQQTPPKIKIFGVAKGADAKQKLTGAELLVQIRSNLKGDTASGYIRNLIEMGGLLKTIAAVTYEMKQKSDEPQINPTKP